MTASGKEVCYVHDRREISDGLGFATENATESVGRVRPGKRTANASGGKAQQQQQQQQLRGG